MDRFEEFLDGAFEADEHYRRTPLSENVRSGVWGYEGMKVGFLVTDRLKLLVPRGVLFIHV